MGGSIRVIIDMDIKFDLVKKDKGLEREQKRRDDFKARADSLLSKYYEQLGANAYAVFNACTDYASHSKSGNVNVFADSMQKKIGKWVDEFAKESKRNDFSLENYIGDYGKDLN